MPAGTMNSLAEVSFSPTEIETGQLTPETLTAANRALREDGIVVLKSIVDPDHLTMLRERMLADLETILARPDAPFNFNTGNVQQDPPPFAPYLFRDVLLNDVVISVTESILGPGLKNGFYSGNTAVPGGTRQPVHPDISQLWSGLEHPTPAYGFVVNIPVVDVTPENGATEVWPGTHRDTTYSIHEGAARIPDEVLAPWRAKRPPLQASTRTGDVIVRDIRLWHAGTPNRTPTPRPMIAMIHWCSWWSEADSIPFPRESEPFLQHPRLRTVARFVDGPVDYLHHSQAYDLQK